jgi:hypothetical protein
MRNLVGLLLICLLASCGARFTDSFAARILPQTADQLATFAEKFQIFERLADFLHQNGIVKQRTTNEINAPIITPPDDPLFLDPANLTLNLDIISGDFFLKEGTIEGLGGLKDDLAFVITLPPIKLNYTLNISAVSFHGDYGADLFLDLTQFGYPTTPITGDGEFFANVSGVWVDVDVLIGVPFGQNKVVIRELHLNFGFENINLYFENALLYGEPIDYWDDINKGLKAVFTYAWADNREEIQESLRVVLNDVVKDCTIADIIGIIGGGDASCLNLPPLPTPPPPVDTTLEPVESTVDPEDESTIEPSQPPVGSTNDPEDPSTIEPSQPPVGSTNDPEDPSTIEPSQPPVGSTNDPVDPSSLPTEPPKHSTIDPPATGSATTIIMATPGIIALIIISFIGV